MGLEDFLGCILPTSLLIQRLYYFGKNLKKKIIIEIDFSCEFCWLIGQAYKSQTFGWVIRKGEWEDLIVLSSKKTIIWCIRYIFIELKILIYYIWLKIRVWFENLELLAYSGRPWCNNRIWWPNSSTSASSHISQRLDIKFNWIMIKIIVVVII